MRPSTLYPIACDKPSAPRHARQRSVRRIIGLSSILQLSFCANAVASHKTPSSYKTVQCTLTHTLTQQSLYAMYKQLASPTTIRVLHVHPASKTDPLTCSLEHCDLNNDPEYEAISYVWGDSDLACSVTCDSMVTPVTRSLHEALLRVRLPDRLRTLWIDGLCINQIDDIEK